MKKIHLKRKRESIFLGPLAVLVVIGLVADTVGLHVSKSGVTAAKAQTDILTKALDRFRLNASRYTNGQEGLTAVVSPVASKFHWRAPYLRKALPSGLRGQSYP